MQDFNIKTARLPKNYKIIFEIVRQGGLGKHLTTGDVYVEAKRRQPGIGYSTVYRGLLRLRDTGLVSEIVAHGEAAAYEPVGPEHAHFFCTACRKLSDLEYTLPENVIRHLAEQEKASITRVSLTLQGRCEPCSRQ